MANRTTIKSGDIGDTQVTEAKLETTAQAKLNNTNDPIFQNASWTFSAGTSSTYNGKDVFMTGAVGSVVTLDAAAQYNRFRIIASGAAITFTASASLTGYLIGETGAVETFTNASKVLTNTRGIYDIYYTANNACIIQINTSLGGGTNLWDFAGAITITNQASMSLPTVFLDNNTGGVNKYRFIFHARGPASLTYPLIEFTTNSGSTWIQSGYYLNQAGSDVTVPTLAGGAGSTAWALTGVDYSDANPYFLNGEGFIFSPDGGTYENARGYARTQYFSNGVSNIVSTMSDAMLNVTSAITGMRMRFGTGNVTSGWLYLYRWNHNFGL